MVLRCIDTIVGILSDSYDIGGGVLFSFLSLFPPVGPSEKRLLPGVVVHYDVKSSC